MSETQATTTPLRRQPVQQRSAKRVEQMLDASAELIDEVGYDALTTTLIAKRAGVAVGSLYQFFPDKRAVVRALTQRNLDRFVQAVSERLSREDPGHWWAVVDSVLDIYLEMHRTVPGFSKVHFGDVVDRQLLDDSRDNNRVIADSLADLVGKYIDLNTPRLSLAMTVAIEAADGLLKLAFHRDPQGDAEIVGETKHLIKGYLASRLGE
ncbi:TetR/AcrR family transcriptional regulator [Amycolatopsis thermophila]|uniref:AcrR family transcriptional regulator n=1 Tax=Amycolatopsis thermophila TaxID=206084 RepID=A0ABU0ES51_9PSEU|nr:TetR family transcriptional regulator [Amycolatopsis thermophila]MDQ0378124.1 AcrR family transcriptional regulator [Amycolatopsis thermophila]